MAVAPDLFFTKRTREVFHLVAPKIHTWLSELIQETG